VVGADADRKQLRYEARLTDASLAAYEREDARLAERLRNSIRQNRVGEAAARTAEWFAWLDQYRRVHAVLGLFSSTARREVEWTRRRSVIGP